MSTRKLFEQELDALKTELVEMCRLTEQMISDAVSALINHDRELGKSIGQADKRVDEYEMDIERKCMHILLRQQPVAKDFREVSVALKVITDIERFGDQASDIGDLVYTMPEGGCCGLQIHIAAMGELTLKMVRKSVDSLIENDQALADEVIRMDDEVDDLFVTVKQELINLIAQDGKNGDRAIEMMMAAKYLERIGDHAVNLAEWSKYNETGVHEKF